MDDEHQEQPSPPAGSIEGATQPQAPLITLDQLLAADVEAPLRGLASVNENVIRQAYFAAYHQAPGGSEARRVMELMQALASIFLKPDNRANIWVPLAAGPGFAFPTPESFRGDQSAILAELIDHIEHPGLRARIADVVWTNDRKQGAAAAKAVEAYRSCVVGLLDGTFMPECEVPPRVVGEALHHLKRMHQILNLTVKRTKRPEWMRETSKAVYDRALRIMDYVTFAEAAQVGLTFGLFDERTVAADAEALASAAPEEDYPDAVRRAWSIGARLYDKLGDSVAANRCRIGAYRCTLAMRRFVLGSAAAEAGWVSDALLELRHIKGLEAEEIALEAELRQLQKLSLKQMGSIPIELDLQDDHQAVAETFEGSPLDEALKNFALLASSQNPESLRADALKMGEESPLAAMMGINHVDGEGRSATKTPGASLSDEEPNEAWFDAMIDRHEGLRRYHMVRGRIDPARILIYSTYGVEERHVIPIVGFSPFVPDEQKFNLVLGFVRFFQGDLISAAHLVIPKLEPCLRHILKINGLDPSKRRDDGTEEDLSLSRIIDPYRQELGQILGAPLTEEIDRLFNKRPGPALRHEFAHGQVQAGECFGHHIIYGVWLMYRLCCLFLLSNWQPVADAIKRAQ